MDPFEALDVATAGFADALSHVQPDQWRLPSPNPGWSVHDVVNHVVGGNRRYVLLLAGAATEDVEALRDLDHLGDAPRAAFAKTAAEVSAAFREPGALTRVVHHRWGDRSGLQLLYMRISEHALHGWDLARAIGADETIDAGVTEVLLAAFDDDPGLINPGAYATDRGVDASTNAVRLLALTGRA